MTCEKTKLVHDELIHAALINAARLGSDQDVKSCLASGCDPLFKDRHGRSALMLAALYGHENCVRLLLPISDPLAQGKDGYSALMLAAWGGSHDCVSLLLAHSDVLAKSVDDEPASTLARGCGHDALADMIDAYQAHSEATLLNTHTLPGSTRQASTQRM